MTRGNINFLSQKLGDRPRTLYMYYNGDQYPRGLRDIFGVLDWLKDESQFNPEGFKKWIAEGYGAVAGEVSHPCIYYDHLGHITDYSYVFSCTGAGNEVIVYEWGKRIFEGSVDKFIEWLKNLKNGD